MRHALYDRDTGQRAAIMIYERLENVPEPPIGYSKPSLQPARSDFVKLERLRVLGRKFTDSSSWVFPNRANAACRLSFDLIEGEGFGAFAWFDGFTHWIAFHKATLEDSARFFDTLFASSEYLGHMGIPTAS